jgi:hypothetical protein
MGGPGRDGLNGGEPGGGRRGVLRALRDLTLDPERSYHPCGFAAIPMS